MAAAVPAFLSGIIGLIGFAQKAALANKQAKLQEEDAARQQVEYNLRAPGLHAGGAHPRIDAGARLLAVRRRARRQRTPAAEPDAIAHQRGARGRLRETGTYAVERGDRLADITRSSVGSPFAAFFGPFLSAFGQAGATTRQPGSSAASAGGNRESAAAGTRFRGCRHWAAPGPDVGCRSRTK